MDRVDYLARHSRLSGKAIHLFVAWLITFWLLLLTIAIPINMNNAPDESRSES